MATQTLQSRKNTHPNLLKRKRGDRPYRLLGLSKTILDILARRFIARTTDLYRLVPRVASKQQDHERAIRAALLRLREYTDPAKKKNDVDRQWGYIRSVSWSDPTIENKIEYTCLVHGLTDRGLRLARERGLDPDHQAKSFQEFSADHVDHEIRILDMMDSLASECAAIGLELIVEQTDIKASTIAPDRLFYIYDPKTDLRSAPSFLEYEKQKRGKYDDGNPQVIRKLDAYERYYDSNLCQKEFGFRKFCVIIILRTERKANFLLQDLAERGLKRKTFLIASEPAIKASVLNAQFRTPKDGLWCSDCGHLRELHLEKGCTYKLKPKVTENCDCKIFNQVSYSLLDI